ncbi:MAG: uncultured phage MedDCM-OCT-S31-C1, partial [Cyanobacteriota bacterium]
IPYQDELIIFSDQIQFRFNTTETVLTPATAVITVLTQYEIDPDCRPIPVAGTIIFCQTNGQWSQFREFSVRGAGTALVADASDLTGYVSSYVPDDVFKLAGNDTGNSWFAISSKAGFRDRIYVYKYFYRNTGGGAERAQSSWSHWQLSGADKILQILCVQEVMFLLVEYGTEVWLEKMPVADRLTGAAAGPYPLLLDRQVSTTTATPTAIRVAAGSYNATTKTTTWTLPYTIKAPTQAWSGFGPTTNGGVLLGQASSGNQIVANGDWSTVPVFFGEAFDFVYRFTRFKLYKEVGGGKVAANATRTQIRHAKLRYHESAYFEVRVMAERRDMALYKFDGTVLGSRNSALGTAMPNGYDLEDKRYYEGVFQIPIASKGENCIVEIHNDTIHPCKFSTCEWVGLLSSQARSLQ